MTNEQKRIAFLLQQYASGLTNVDEEQELFRFIEQDIHAEEIQNLMMSMLERQHSPSD
jgi:hypothetical protein